MSSANGEGALAGHLVSLTERLTLLPELSATTFIPWRDVVSRVDLQRLISYIFFTEALNERQGRGSNIFFSHEGSLRGHGDFGSSPKNPWPPALFDILGRSVVPSFLVILGKVVFPGET
jgi:hypothetical protein